jgi:hypothetical protein
MPLLPSRERSVRAEARLCGLGPPRYKIDRQWFLSVKACYQESQATEAWKEEEFNCTRLIRGLIVALLFRQAF